MKFKAVLFDLDGTLMNSEDSWWNAFNIVLKNRGMEPVGADEFKRKYSGRFIDDDVMEKFPEASGHQVEEIANEWKMIFSGMVHLSKPNSHAIEILQYVKGKGLKCALVTNTTRELALKVLGNMKAVEYFDETVCGGEAIPKPHPDPVIKACGMLGVSPGSSVYVEDSVSGVKTGMAAGTFTVGLVGTTGADALKAAGADMIISDLEELKKIF
jgi:HAD superfamily hydrolase (TIGR01509 family)